MSDIQSYSKTAKWYTFVTAHLMNSVLMHSFLCYFFRILK